MGLFSFLGDLFGGTKRAASSSTQNMTGQQTGTTTNNQTGMINSDNTTNGLSNTNSSTNTSNVGSNVGTTSGVTSGYSTGGQVGQTSNVGTSTSTGLAAAQPYISGLLPDAANAFAASGQANPASTAAATALEGVSAAPSALSTAGGGYLSDVLSGKYLDASNNPGLQSVINQTAATTGSQIGGTFGGEGRSGGGLAALLSGQGVANAVGGILNNNYQAERGRMGEAAGMAGTYDNGQLGRALSLANEGRTAAATPLDNATRYGGLLGAISGTGGTSTAANAGSSAANSVGTSGNTSSGVSANNSVQSGTSDTSSTTASLIDAIQRAITSQRTFGTANTNTTESGKSTGNSSTTDPSSGLFGKMLSKLIGV